MSLPIASARALMPRDEATSPAPMSAGALLALSRLVGGGPLTAIYEADGTTIRAAWFMTAATAFLYSSAKGLNTSLCPRRISHKKKINNWIQNHSRGWPLKGLLMETEWHRQRGVKATHIGMYTSVFPLTVPPTASADSCGGIL